MGKKSSRARRSQRKGKGPDEAGAPMGELRERHRGSTPRGMKRLVNRFDKAFRSHHTAVVKLEDFKYGCVDRILKKSGKRLSAKRSDDAMIKVHKPYAPIASRWLAAMKYKRREHDNTLQEFGGLKREISALVTVKKGGEHAEELLELLVKKRDNAIKARERAIADIGRWAGDFSPKLINENGEFDLEEVKREAILATAVGRTVRMGLRVGVSSKRHSEERIEFYDEMIERLRPKPPLSEVLAPFERAIKKLKKGHGNRVKGLEKKVDKMRAMHDEAKNALAETERELAQVIGHSKLATVHNVLTGLASQYQREFKPLGELEVLEIFPGHSVLSERDVTNVIWAADNLGSGTQALVSKAGIEAEDLDFRETGWFREIEDRRKDWAEAKDRAGSVGAELSRSIGELLSANEDFKRDLKSIERKITRAKRKRIS